MLKRILLLVTILPLGLGLLAACAKLQGGHEFPARHPVEMEEGRPVCTECHEARGERVPYGRFNHTVLWADNHRQAAYQGERTCNLCHSTSFCNDCHATRVELKPSLKDQTGNFRRMPHRGDYLSRHRIDGRIDPTSCFRCNGNPKSSRTCVSCHG
ncbi:MAG: cytochrome C [Desulfuromonas sp.]|uniref:cytochrome C n=1 Tax=Desulfuromonas sp. TaxID=892 RepID=UPI000CB24E43|nr:cytochrome C [Desulfuromonas sp.]PLX83809.1 MAG: cytochrome C [Desulfuromonas sp.]